MGLCGASAVEVLSVVMHEGFGALGRILQELESFLIRREMTFRELIGRTADALGRYADQPERPGRWRDFVPPETLA
jgi:dihydroorotate dehydrogenase (NAD+) catalytic subunit